eukprot:1012096-Pyramimonas_sp.AAC.1
MAASEGDGGRLQWWCSRRIPGASFRRGSPTIDHDSLCYEVERVFREEDGQIMKFRVTLACFRLPGADNE